MTTRSDARRPRILVVEDDTAAADLLVELLSERWEVVVASSSQEGVARYFDLRPDLVILDMRLESGADGLDVFQQIRAAIGHAPRAIMVSGADESERAAQAMQIPVLRKPIRERTIVYLVEVVLAAEHR